MKIVLACDRPWGRLTLDELQKRLACDIHFVTDPKDLQAEYLLNLKPRFVFFTHWSSIVPREIFEGYECIIFHMTDLPFGRGGSPLQNLISRGVSETKLSAIRCVQEIDGGPIYLKRPLSLFGNAEEVFMRASRLAADMIFEITTTEIDPSPQEGEPTKFARRRPEDGDWSEAESLDEIFDFIRMLDASGYPKSYIRMGSFRLEFSRASRGVDGIRADVLITYEG